MDSGLAPGAGVVRAHARIDTATANLLIMVEFKNLITPPTLSLSFLKSVFFNHATAVNSHTLCTRHCAPHRQPHVPPNPPLPPPPAAHHRAQSVPQPPPTLERVNFNCCAIKIGYVLCSWAVNLFLSFSLHTTVAMPNAIHSPPPTSPAPRR